MKSATLSATMIVGAFVLPLVISGKTLASATRKFLNPLTIQPRAETTAIGSESRLPILAVPQGW